MVLGPKQLSVKQLDAHLVVSVTGVKMLEAWCFLTASNLAVPSAHL